jgi:hypothetical protein
MLIEKVSTFAVLEPIQDIYGGSCFSQNGFFSPLSSSSRCSGDKSFLLLLMFGALVALIVVAASRALELIALPSRELRVAYCGPSMSTFSIVGHF